MNASIYILVIYLFFPGTQYGGSMTRGITDDYSKFEVIEFRSEGACKKAESYYKGFFRNIERKSVRCFKK